MELGESAEYVSLPFDKSKVCIRRLQNLEHAVISSNVHGQASLHWTLCLRHTAGHHLETIFPY